jgi:hypothetical protein
MVDYMFSHTDTVPASELQMACNYGGVESPKQSRQFSMMLMKKCKSLHTMFINYVWCSQVLYLYNSWLNETNDITTTVLIKRHWYMACNRLDMKVTGSLISSTFMNSFGVAVFQKLPLSGVFHISALTSWLVGPFF